MNNRIKFLVSSSENQYLERKSARIEPLDILKHLVAFANADGGSLVIGVEDNREIFSCEIFKELIDSQTEKKFIEYLKNKNLTFIKRHKDLELNLSYLRENDRFKKYFSKIFSGREDNAKMKYEILVFRNEEVEVVYDSRNKSV